MCHNYTGQEYYSEPSVETAIYTARKARKNSLPAGSTSPSASGHVQGNPLSNNGLVK
jgi:hypothetical protein